MATVVSGPILSSPRCPDNAGDSVSLIDNIFFSLSHDSHMNQFLPKCNSTRTISFEEDYKYTSSLIVTI